MLRVRGIVYLGLSSLVIWHEFGDKTGREWIPQLEKYSETLGTIGYCLVQLLIFAIMVIAILYFFKGLNFTFISGDLSVAQYRKTPFGNIIWGRGSISSYLSGSSGASKIDRLKQYRDSKFETMTMEQKANEYRKTAWIDGLDSNTTPNANRARDYINSKLTCMDNETAYKWLKNE